MKLSAKIFIEGKIEVLTGLTIGGSSTALDIGGIDNPVIKKSNGEPYIPGSSLKGKIRCLLERAEGHDKITKTGIIAEIFGSSASESSDLGCTRVYFRDTLLDKAIASKMKNKQEDFSELEMNYTESKTENVIDRLTSATVKGGLRSMERVPAGAKFDFEIVYNVFGKQDIDNLRLLLKGMRLLEDDYLGGSGSRGYGKIKFYELKMGIKTIKNYETDNKRQLVFETFDLQENFSRIKKEIENKLEVNNANS